MNHRSLSLMNPYSLIFLLGIVIASCDNSSFSGDGAKKRSAPSKPKTTDQNTDEGPDASYTADEVDVENPDFDGDLDKDDLGWDGDSPGPGAQVKPGFDYDDAPLPEKVKDALGELSEGQKKQARLTKPYEVKSQDQFWIVTTKGIAYHYTLVGDKVFKTKKWTFPFYGTGSRTYLTEGGFVFTNNGGRLWWIDPTKTPEGALDRTSGGKNHWRLPGVGDDDRSCVVSFLRGNKRYLGIGHGKGRYSELELENKPPYKPIWNVVRTGRINADRWGYSCHIDNKKLIYYGGWVKGKIYALDLKTLKEVDAGTSAPNGNFVASKFPDESIGPASNGSYALAGDRKGHIFNGHDFYTFAHDGTSKLIFGSSRDGNSLFVYPEACLTTDSKCSTADRKVFNFKGLVGKTVGPLGSLVSGGIIGVNRNRDGGFPFGASSEESDIFLIRPKNKKNLNAGIDVKMIAQSVGDPYMYTDFTGSTLYLQNGDLVFDLRKNENFDDKLAVRGLLFSWSSETGSNEEWGDAKLQIRCYNKGKIPSQFSTIKSIPKSSKTIHIEAGSCRDTDVNQVEVKVTQLNGGSFVQDIKSIHISFFQ